MTQSDQPETEEHLARPQNPDREALLDYWRNLPHVDPDKMRHDIDEAIDPSL